MSRARLRGSSHSSSGGGGGDQARFRFSLKQTEVARIASEPRMAQADGWNKDLALCHDLTRKKRQLTGVGHSINVHMPKQRRGEVKVNVPLSSRARQAVITKTGRWRHG